MSDVTAEQLGKRAHECGLLEPQQVQEAFVAAGGHDHATYDSLVSALLQKELLTNWQLDRLVKGEIRGYFFGKWKILYFIGAGTFARVYRAVHTETGDVKAVKILRIRHSGEESSREQFMREAKMVMKLRHPNIVPIFEVEEDSGRIYMVMDFVEGQNLRDYFKAHRKIPILTSLNIVRDIASGLAYAFDRNITHRDLKLSNVLLSAKGQAKLVDFGLAMMDVGDVGKGSTNLPRSIDYAGLEKVSKASRDDKRSDLYFLGCMLYEMISGKAPLLETRERAKRMSADRFTKVIPIVVHEAELPDRLVIFINRLMELDPKKRIQTPALVQQEAEAVIQLIESGNVQSYDANTSEQAAKEYAQQLLLKEEGRGHTIMLIESNTRLQDLLRENLKEIGYRVLITNDPVRGLERFTDMSAEDDNSGCVLFGCVGLGREAMQAFHNFAINEETKEIPSILIVTSKLTRYLDEDLMGDNHLVFEMPLKFGKLKQGLRKLLGIDLSQAAAQMAGEPQRQATNTVQDSSDATDVE